MEDPVCDFGVTAIERRRNELIAVSFQSLARPRPVRAYPRSPPLSNSKRWRNFRPMTSGCRIDATSSLRSLIRVERKRLLCIITDASAMHSS